MWTMETCPFKTSENTLRCCLCPLKIFSRCRGAFHPFRAAAGNVKKLGVKRENPFRIKKRLPNLSSAVTLLLLSYLAQSPTGRCQSGRMSTPGKCVYRKSVPRVRIPPCPPSIFCRNIFVMSILRFLFVGVWGRNGEKSFLLSPSHDRISLRYIIVKFSFTLYNLFVQ